jgi:transcriptional regulator with XRE-family HTH domain
MAFERARPFGELLRDYRSAAGMTQEELAERAGLSARTLRKLERGDSHTPRKDTILLLADALGLPPEQPPRVKPLLYVYRVLLTGIHLLRTGEVEANLPRLNDIFRLPYISELIERKRTGAERGALPAADPLADLAFHQREYERLLHELDEAAAESTLPEVPTARPALDDLLIRVRLGGLSAGA